MKLWEKNYELNKKIEKFTVNDDYIIDQDLIKYDCKASIAHAKMLEKALSEVPNIKIKPADTNIVIADTSETPWSAREILTRFNEKSVKISQMGDYLFRMVTYFGITKEDIERVILKIPEVFQ